MVSQLQKVSVLLNGGMDEQSASELAGPVASQGGSLTLRKSLNTRLSRIPGTCVRAPDAPVASTLNAPLYGLVPAASGRNTLALHSPGVGCEMLSEAGATGVLGAGPLKSDVFAGLVPLYFPGQVSAAGAIPSVSAIQPPVTCVDSTTGNVWTAYVGTDPASSSPYLYVTVSSPSNALLAPSTAVMTFVGTTGPWLGITSHGTNGIRVWMKVGTDLVARALSLSGNTITAGSLSTVFAGFSWTVQPAVASGVYVGFGSVDITNQDYAYFSGGTSGGDGKVWRVNVNTYVNTSSTYAGILASGEDSAICYAVVGGVRTVGVAFAADLLLSAYTLNATTLATLTSGSNVESSGTVAAQFFQRPGTSGLMVALTAKTSTFTASAAGFTRFYDLTASLAAGATLPWVALYSKGCALPVSATETAALFDTVRVYSSSLELPTSLNYALDPSVVVYLASGRNSVAACARFGTVRSVLSPVHIDPTQKLVQSATLSLTSKPRFTWLKDILDNSLDTGAVPGNSAQVEYPARFTELSFAAMQPSLVHDKDGTTLVSGALPVQWDGNEIVEVGGPIHIPKISVANTGGTGPVLTAGAYRFAVHYEWTDLSGLTHRSAPAIVNWTSAGSSPMLRATVPDGLKNGIARSAARVVFYGTATNGATLHRLTSTQAQVGGIVLMSAVPTADTARQILYTEGAAAQQQPPQPPPPTSDWTIVGDRVVGIDAEVPNRLFHSKRRVSGVGFEFSPFYEILLPSGVGAAVAVREWQGTIVVFCERAILQVGGSGPDNLVGNPSGGSFSPPIRVGSVGCTNRRSVVVTPKGIFFQRGTDILVFTGGEPSIVAGVQFAADATGGLLIPDHDEVVLLLNDTARVFNYALGRWTRWETVAGDDIQFGARLPWTNDLTLLGSAGNAPNVRLLDANALSQTAAMQWESDWIVLGGDFEDRINLQWVTLSALRKSAHGLRIEVFANFDERVFDAPNTTPNSTLREYSAAEITDLAPLGRYTLKVQPRPQAASRAVKFRITEFDLTEDRQGVQPVCLTLYYRVENITNETAIVPGAYK